MIKNRIVNLIKKIYPRYGLQEDDIILASFPKSGNTWIRFIWYNMISQTEFDGKEVDFYTISGPFKAQYDDHSYGKAEFQCLPRLVKTHKRYDNRFGKNKTIYLWRDPRDTMVSYYEYMKGEYNMKEPKNLKSFIKSDQYGIENWCKHVKSWQNSADVIISYESLKKDTKDVLTNLLKQLDVGEIDNDVIKESVYRSRFENMRKIETTKGRPLPRKKSAHNDYKFTRKGKIGEWKARLDEEDIQYINDAISKYDLDSFIE